MKKQFQIVIEREGAWYIAHCPEVPGAQGRGKTWEECRENVVEAIRQILSEKGDQGSSEPED